MKEDIYELLAKHFHGPITSSEEKRIVDFKKKHPVEYRQLKKIWSSKGSFTTHDFDTNAAWGKVVQRANPTRRGIIPFYSKKFAQIAAVIAILVSGAVIGYNYFSPFDPMPIVQISAGQNAELVVLNDSSKVWLGKNASLTYPKEFEKNRRVVTLNGQAFFEVEKNREKPFFVKTTNAETKVLGTSFNVNANEQTTEVTVVTGKVSVSSLIDDRVIITPGYSAKVEDGAVTSFVTSDPNYRSWKTGKFVFDETRLSKVVADLNGYYNGQITLEKNDLADCKISADFDRLPLSEIMEMIELTCDAKVELRNNKYFIKY